MRNLAQTIHANLLESFTSTVKVLCGLGGVPREASDGLTKSLNKQLENMANTCRNCAPIPNGHPATNFGVPSFDIVNLKKFQSNVANLQLPKFYIASLKIDEVSEDMKTMVLLKQDRSVHQQNQL